MDCSGRSNTIERDSELGDDMSHDDHTDDEMRDCDSVEREQQQQHIGRSEHLNTSLPSNGGNMEYSAVGRRTPVDHTNDMPMSHHHHFPSNHPLSALRDFISIGGLHSIQNLQHSDVLEKLKMQVPDMKVGLMEQDYAVHAAAFGGNVLPAPITTAFTMPPTTMPPFSHVDQGVVSQSGNNVITCKIKSIRTITSSGGPMLNGCNSNNSNFSFTSPTAPSTKDVNPASNSSPLSDTSNSSQQNNGWSFEEQYKQVRQLYEINDDPKRKEFLDDLFSFMQKKGSPINRLPIMAKSVLDLYELYNLVIARGGLVDVINKKLWQEIIKGLHLPSSITSAAFTLRTQYMKYLYPYECDKKNLSTPDELQAAIDGNRREGRRSSYGQYEAIHNQLPMQQMARQSLSGGLQQMSPLALVTHAAAANNPQAAAQAAAAAAHHRLMTAPAFAQMPNLMSHDFEQRMLEYLKLLQANKEQNVEAAASAISNSNGNGHTMTHSQQQSAQQHQSTSRQRSQSPDVSQHEAFNVLGMSRVALWQMVNNHASPPVSVNASLHGEGDSGGDVGNSNVKSGSEISGIKREHVTSPEQYGREDFFNHQPPPTKRANFYIPVAPNFQYKDNDSNGDPHPEPDEDDGEQNSTTNSPPGDTNERPLNGIPGHLSGFQDMGNSVHHDKSDDSAIENSPSTSAASGATTQVSPISTKKINLSKQVHQTNDPSSDHPNDVKKLTACNSAFDLLSGLQFRVTRSDISTNGEHRLTVNLELNGVTYSGILNANISGATKTMKTESDIVDSSKKNDNDGNNVNCIGNHSASTTNAYASTFEQPKVVDPAIAEIASDTETPPKRPAAIVTSNGSTKASLNNTLISS